MRRTKSPKIWRWREEKRVLASVGVGRGTSEPFLRAHFLSHTSTPLRTQMGAKESFAPDPAEEELE